jgi:hypothetical protein
VTPDSAQLEPALPQAALLAPSRPHSAARMGKGWFAHGLKAFLARFCAALAGSPYLCRNVQGDINMINSTIDNFSTRKFPPNAIIFHIVIDTKSNHVLGVKNSDTS